MSLSVHDQAECAQAALKSESVSSIWQAFHAISDVTPLSDLPDAQVGARTRESLTDGGRRGLTLGSVSRSLVSD